jgi:hypothetical protein
MQYTMYGDSTTVRAGHSRYGPLAQVVQLTGGGTVTLRPTKSKYARESAKVFSSISILYGRPSQEFEVKVMADTLTPRVEPKKERAGWCSKPSISRVPFPRPLSALRAAPRFTASVPTAKAA